MAIIEVKGGRVTARYLERKHTKASLAHEYMSLLREYENILERVAALEKEIERLKEYEWMYNDLCK